MLRLSRSISKGIAWRSVVRLALIAILIVAIFSMALLTTPPRPAAAAPGPFYLNEVMYNPPGTDGPNEYIEVRGAPNTTIPAGVYFVGVEGDSGGNAGDVQTIIPLAGYTTGSNGFLVLRQNGSPWTVDSSATVITPATGTGWGGLTGFLSDAGTDIENISVTFFIIQTSTAPTLANDIDGTDGGTANDGIPTGTVWSGWTVYDSIGIMDAGATDRVYGLHNYCRAACAPVTGTATTVTVDIDYVGRQTTDPNGSTAADWVAGTLTGAVPATALSSTGTSVYPSSYAGEAIDHVGGPNFPISGVLFASNGRSGVANASLAVQQTFTGVDGVLITVGDPDGIASVVATSGNTAIIPNANLSTIFVSGSSTSATYRLDLIPNVGPGAAGGVATITVTVTDTLNNTSIGAFTYAANQDDVTTLTDRYATGSAEASAAVPVSAGLMFAADDEDQVIRLYDRDVSRLPYSGFDLTASLALTDLSGGIPREVDFEGGTINGTTVYFMGSHSNSSTGANRPNRSRIVTAAMSGSGTGTTLAYTARYDHLKTDLLAWDSGSGHGLGANFFGLTASAAVGVIPEGANGFNIEGLSLTPGSSTAAFIGFRAPLVPVGTRNLALVVPITNFTTMQTAAGGTAGSAIFGAPIQLNLGGRGIRSIECQASGCLIVAGAADGTDNFALYTWTGIAADAPVLIASDLSNKNPEGLVEAPTGTIATWGGQTVHLISDNGDTDFYGVGTLSGDYTTVQLRKFRHDRVTLGIGTAPGTNRVRTIQGTRHLSPLAGTGVQNVPGVVTALRSNGFYLQDPDLSGDDGLASSEAIFVFTGGGSSLLTGRTVGETILVSGTVTEFRPGGDANNLTLTEIVNNNAVQRLAITAWDCTGVCTVSPTVIGTGGRIPPAGTISTFSGDVETRPALVLSEGLDFYESLEGMLVQVNNAIVVGPTNTFGELWVVGDNAANATGINGRGGITIRPGDFNPERIQIDDGITGGPSTPALHVGAVIPQIRGVIDYSFGNFELLARDAYTSTASTLTPQVNDLTGGGDRYVIATFNVENLPGNAAAVEFENRARVIVNNLLSPDVILLQEMQDNNGAAGGGVTAGDLTFTNLIAAIANVGGPADYAYVQIDPQNGTDGGQPNGNIRVGYLYRTSRVTFTPIGAATATTANSITCTASTPSLTLNPGRIDPTNSAFNSSRKPLAAQFEIAGETFIIVNNHLNSKGGDQPLMGRFQPPTLTSEVQRLQQVAVIRDFVNAILACNNQTNVILGGDMNDFQYSPPMQTLIGTTPPLQLMNLYRPELERYGYVFEGNSQALDQFVVSPNLTANWAAAYRALHVNSEFFAAALGASPRVSDHDPSILRIELNGGPSEPPPGGGGSGSTAAGGTGSPPLSLPATGYEPTPTNGGGWIVLGLGLVFALVGGVMLRRRR